MKIKFNCKKKAQAFLQRVLRPAIIVLGKDGNYWVTSLSEAEKALMDRGENESQFDRVS